MGTMIGFLDVWGIERDAKHSNNSEGTPSNQRTKCRDKRNPMKILIIR